MEKSLLEIITLRVGYSSKEWENKFNSFLRLNKIQLTYFILVADALTMKAYARCSLPAVVNTLSLGGCKTRQDSDRKCRILFCLQDLHVSPNQ